MDGQREPAQAHRRGGGRTKPTALPGGYAYVALLIAVAMIGAGLGGAAQVWHTMAQRERERQLLWVGAQYRQAIHLYVTGGGIRGAGAVAGLPGAGGQPAISVAVPSGPQTGVSGQSDVGGAPTTVPGTTGQGTAGGVAGAGVAVGNTRYPPTLEALLSDPRNQQVHRYLRKLYPDPITGKNDWVLIAAPGGGIMGVHSASDAAPLKQANFSPDDNDFTGKEHYSDWLFRYVPTLRQPGAGQQQVPLPVPSYGPAPGIPVSPIGQPQ